MNTAGKGRRNEWKTRDLLRREGYHVVRSAGSKGIVDIVAFNGQRLLLVQVKTNGGMSSEDIQNLKSLPAPPFASKQLWVWRDYAKTPEIMEVA